jgi:inorganic triphosphatase YgiF
MDTEVTDWLETEHKYDVDPDFALPDLAGLAAGLGVTEPVVQDLAASYYDTADLSLAAAGVTLRRRTGGADAGWHLKLPVAPDSRRELRAPLGPGAQSVPDRLAAQVRTWTGGQPLQVIAVLETTRTVRRITGPAGQDLAEVADDLVAARRAAPAGGDGASLTWREIEVELISGTPAILAAAGTRLRAAGARPSASASKLSRLLGASPGADPGPAGAPPA